MHRAGGKRLNLDKPFYKEFGYFVWHFVRGDENGWPGLGYSYSGFVPVKDQISQRAPRTLWLIFGAATIWLVVRGRHRRALRGEAEIDHRSAAMGFALFGICAPVFWLGLMALWIFWRKLHWTGGTGYVPLSDGVGSWFSHLILPWTVLALLYMAIYAA